jgi:hypothetical protein
MSVKSVGRDPLSRSAAAGVIKESYEIVHSADCRECRDGWAEVAQSHTSGSVVVVIWLLFGCMFGLAPYHLSSLHRKELRLC